MASYGPAKAELGKKTKGGGATTLLGKFTSQLNDLMSVLDASDPNFIKCVKPNDIKSPLEVKAQLVLDQLRYSGVLQVVQIRKAGYPTRKSLSDFRGLYWAVAGISSREIADYQEVDFSGRRRFAESKDLEFCNKIVGSLRRRHEGCDAMRVGHTMVFFKPEILSLLNETRKSLEEIVAIRSQTLYRRHIAYRKIRSLYEIRDNLRAVTADGNQHNRGNVSATPLLKLRLAEFTTAIGTYRTEVTLATDLLDRLQQVQMVFDSLDLALSVDGKSSFPDIISEFKNAEQIAKSLEDLGVSHPSQPVIFF